MLDLARRPSLPAVARFASGAIPACWAASRIEAQPDAAHALGALRALGGYTGALRALDLVWTSIFLALPLGTRAFRAGLASAFALALFGIVAHAVSLRLLAALGPAPSRLRPIFATVGSLTISLAAAAQTEGAAPAGSALGAALALAPLAVESRALASLLLGLALSYEPGAGLVALGALVLGRPRAGALALGLAPLALALVGRLAPLASDAPFFAYPLGEGARASVDLRALLEDELGPVLLALALLGLALGAARRVKLAGALAFAACAGLALTTVGAPAGPARFSPAALAALASLAILASGALHDLVLYVARAPVPWAKASAAMALVFALVLPIKTADDADLRLRDRAGATGAWCAELELAPHTLLVSGARPVNELLLALRASGEIARDVIVLPTSDIGGRGASRAILRDPLLAPLARDLVLGGAPQEYALAALSASRPVILVWEPRWDRALARHLLPRGLFDRFFSEPRGASDRKRALDLFAGSRDRLAPATLGDPELRRATASLLRARALAASASGDREAATRTVDDLRRFAPNEDGSEVSERIVLARGPIDVADLHP